MNLIYAFTVITVSLVIVTGIYSLLTTKNLVRVIISIELLTKAASLFIIVVGNVINRPNLAQSMVVTIIVVEVVTVAVAAGLAAGLFQRFGTMNIERIGNKKDRGDE